MTHCYDCNIPYDTARFPDLIIETWAWKRISPTGDEGGLLCPCCICARLYVEGISCQAVFTSGPLAVKEDPPWLLKERLLRLEDYVLDRAIQADTRPTPEIQMVLDTARGM